MGRVTDGQRSFNALIRPAGELVDLSDRFPDTPSIYQDWDRSFEALDDLSRTAKQVADSLDGYRFLPPTDRPQIFCAGSNYRQHAAEMYTFNEGAYQKERLPGESDDDFYQRNLAFVTDKRAQGMPFIWLATFGSLVGSDDDIVLPSVGKAHDWEAELTAVLAGGSPRYLTPDEASTFIAGYAIGNDMHTGDLFSRSDIKWNADWIAKQPPTFKQIGPYVVPRQFVGDLNDLQITLHVNGEIKQDWPAGDMIFSPAEYLAYASERLPVLAGDVLMMGSPPGNGGVHGQFLVPGDEVDIAITGLGSQHHRVIAEETDGRKPYYGLPVFE
ncbi:fumarylacetoacetate hydrolase family protein [Cryptosporangium phraense]|uniref:Fumarylacetoacetate hydrolase family protein n=1 Tax=Cryptosporangium phraense TaxID=2593070 RepID=A0A545AV13_9ACTN|nr:fumarylacetoacetate hydrolase family protein [Cryptosporangium phraense]